MGPSTFESTSVKYKYFEALSSTSTSVPAEIKVYLSTVKYCKMST